MSDELKPEATEQEEAAASEAAEATEAVTEQLDSFSSDDLAETAESSESLDAEAALSEMPPHPSIAGPADDDDDELLVTPGMNWFVLRVASNKEDSVRATLLRKIKIEDMTHLVNRIMVPTEKEKTIKAGKQKIIEKKLYPGYVFVEMQLEKDGRIPQDVFFLIKETTGVGDFIGTAGRPSPMTLPEIEKMMIASKPVEEQPQVKMEFAPGDHVKITSGPFENMEATVDELLPDQGKVRVVVTIFGRATPVELEYWLIEKFEE